MLVFDIPFHPPQNTWTISLPSGASRAFAERHEAVRFAAKEASRLVTHLGRQVQPVIVPSSPINVPVRCEKVRRRRHPC
jgi:hypothetical protein